MLIVLIMQIINIQVGCGLPFLVSCLTRQKPLAISQHNLSITTFSLVLIVFAFFLLTLLRARVVRFKNYSSIFTTFGRLMAFIMTIIYVACMVVVVWDTQFGIKKQKHKNMNSTNIDFNQ